MANAAFVRSRSDNNASVFAEFETNLRHERQMEGISAAKARASNDAANSPRGSKSVRQTPKGQPGLLIEGLPGTI